MILLAQIVPALALRSFVRLAMFPPFWSTSFFMVLSYAPGLLVYFPISALVSAISLGVLWFFLLENGI